MVCAARLALIAAAVVLSGCSPRARTEPDSKRQERPPVLLRIAVVGDATLTRAIDRLRGEWSGRGDGRFEAESVDADSDLAELCAAFDLVVFPSRRLGALCEADLLRPIRDSVLRSDALRFTDFFPAIREAEVVYGARVMALPLGCPTPLVLRTSDGALEAPTDDRRLALAFLAWSAPHAVHRSRTATLFDTEDLRPLIAGPPFARALDEFADAASGEASGASIVWPRRDMAVAAGDADPSVERPPGAAEVYNPIAGEWEPTDPSDRRATLVASSGRLLGVTASSRNAAPAFRLAAWLAGVDNGPRLSTASDSVANCRGSMARRPDPWVSGPRSLASDFAEQAAEALRSPRLLVAPRIPGADEYLRALGEQVRARMSGERDSAAALGAAVRAWSAISERIGLDSQLQAYRRSVNAAEYSPATR